MQTALAYRTNRDLFSNYYLDEHLPDTEAWTEVDDEELRDAYERVRALYEREKDTAPKRNESQLEEKFVRPMFRELGIPFEVEESTGRTQRRPDYGFFASQEAARNAFDRREAGGDFYEDAVAVADAKRWGRPLDTRGSGEHERDFENPSYQIHVYLQETPARWAVLTDGRTWRLYYGPTSHRLDSYYEIDLPTVLETGDLEEFRYFYLFFRHEAFLEDAGGDCFLDDVHDESNVFARELGEDLQDNIYEAIKVLSEGFLQYPDNDLDEGDLDLIHDSSLIYLYRLIFVLYAESEGRDLLETDNEIYQQSYSLNALKQDVAEELDDPDPSFRDWQDSLWSRLDELFQLIDQGSRSRGIPEDDLHILAYNGGLFRTDPDADDSPEARFLADHEVGDAHLARVIELLTRSRNGNGGGKIFVDYSSLDVRHLGSIYEGLLEYELNVADEPLALVEGEYVPIADAEEASDDVGEGQDAGEGVDAGAGDGVADADVAVEAGEVYLTTGSGERKATGSYYTPEYVVEYIVENTLAPLVTEIREDLMARSARGEDRGFAAEFAERVFELKILDPAMGSGHFLTSAVDYLAREIIDAQEKQAAQQGVETVDQSHDINWARRQVAQRCIYGVDLNPLAVELAKVSLWLRTLAAEQPLAFLDHHLKTGNSLVGSDIEEIEELESESGGDGENASLADFGVARQGTIEQLIHIYQEFIAIENQDLADVKEMEAKYDEFERNKLRRRIEAMANVHTAEEFGLDVVPEDAYKRLASALERDETWYEIEEMVWFRQAQRWAKEGRFFHWRIEFPEVFYNAAGSERRDLGFDSVIGNPPYVAVGGDLEEYLRSEYEVPSYFIDLFHVFIERGLHLARDDGQFGFIVPEPWLTMENTESLRDFVLENAWIREVLQFDQMVFEEATVDTIVLLLQKSGIQGDTLVRNGLNANSYLSSMEEIYATPQTEFLEARNKRIEIRQSVAERQLLEKIHSNSIPLGEIAEISIGIQAYNSSKHTQEQIENKVFHADHKKGEDYYPELAGQDVSRYHIEFTDDRWVKYGDHLHDYRPMRFFSEPRILVREITDSGQHRIHASYTDETYCNYKTILNILADNGYDLEYILAVLNSSLMSWIFPRTSNKVVSDTFPRISVSDLEALPFPEVHVEEDGQANAEELEETYAEYLVGSRPLRDTVADVSERPESAHGFLAFLGGKMIEYTDDRVSLNLDLLDNLGTYDDGASLSELPGYQPASAVHDSILTATSEDLESLRAGRVIAYEEGSKVVIAVSARYKPEDEGSEETDRWGYTETDPVPAMEFVGLDELHRELVKEFVPYATEEAGGFAGFRETATKTNSLVDRLEDLTLPELDDVADGLERYLGSKARADELDEKIDRTDELIDQIVYELYGLTDAEIDIVEEAVTSGGV